MEILLFRLSLKAKEIVGLFEPKGPNGAFLSREQWLRFFFGSQRTFVHRGSEYLFIPEIGLEAKQFVFGWVGRRKTLLERTPPSEGFEPTQHQSWQAAFIAIDPSDHDDGQKIALEANSNVGEPAAILRSLVRAMNQVDSTPYECLSYPIIESGSFKAFAAEHGGLIKSIAFDIAVPNMFDGADDFQKENRMLRDRLNVSRVRTKMNSDTTLKHDDEKISEIIDYTERGGGKLTAKAEDGGTYDSDTRIKTVSLEIEHHSKDDQGFLRQIIKFLDRIF